MDPSAQTQDRPGSLGAAGAAEGWGVGGPRELRIERMDTSPTLYIAHAKELIRTGLLTMASDNGLRVAGCAGDSDGALVGITQTRPTVAIIDCQLAGDGGFATARAVADAAPSVRVVMMSVSADGNHLARAHAAGAVNCVAKGLPADNIMAAIAEAAAGRRPSPPDPFAVVVERLEAADPLPAEAHLTRRERQVLRHLAYGLDNNEIARALSIGLETVKTHVHKLLTRMELRDRTQAAVWAVKHGIA